MDQKPEGKGQKRLRRSTWSLRRRLSALFYTSLVLMLLIFQSLVPGLNSHVIQGSTLSQKIIFITFFGLYLVGFGLLLITAISLRRRLVLPLEKLKKGVESITKGDLNYRLNLNQSDEIGQLGNAFDEMAGWLQLELELRKDALQELHQLNKELEKRVRVRTEELGSLNLELRREIDERQRAEDELRWSLKRTMLLNRVIAASVSTRELQGVLEIMCRELAVALELPQAGFALLDPDQRNLKVVAEYREAGRPSALEAVIPVEGNPATLFVIERNTPLVIDNAQTDERQKIIHELEKERGTVSLLIVPLVIRGQVIGTLGLDSLEERHFTQEEIKLAQNVAAAATNAIENIQLYDTIQQELVERRRMEEALRESESRHRQSVEKFPNPIFSVNQMGKITWWNQACERVFQFSPQILGHDYQDVLQLPEDQEYLRELVEKVLTAQLSYSDVDITYLCRDGSLRFTNSRLYPVIDMEGRVEGCVFANTDLTEQKTAAADLENQLKELTALHAVAKAANEAKDENSLIEWATQIIGETFQSDHFGVLLIDETTGILRHHPSYRIEGGSQVLAPIPEYAGELIRGQNGIHQIKWKGNGANPDFEKSDCVYSELWSPLKSGQNILGVITIKSGSPAGFCEKDQKLISVLAGQIGTAIERLRLLNALGTSEARYRSLFDGVPVGLYIADPVGSLIDCNNFLVKMLGYPDRETLFSSSGLGMHLTSLFNPGLYAEVIDDGGSVYHYETTVRRYDGKPIWVENKAKTVCGPDGKVIYYEGSLQDITKRKEAEQELKLKALHDNLTNLPNRNLFMEKLDKVVERSGKSRGRQAAVLFLDLDRFKVINDSLGHETGDLLLVAIARRLESCLRPEDTVARFGGDEFAILLEQIETTKDATRVADRVQKKLSMPFNLKGQEIFTSASIGIALTNGNEQCPEDLLRDADTAMYQAKAEGKARYAIFDEQMHSHVLSILQIEGDLRRAIERQELLLYYQPIISLKDGSIKGVEALLRWDHPQRGLLLPKDFISVADETGFINHIGEWVLRTACKQVRIWQELGYTDLHASVNISTHQFQDHSLVELIDGVLRETGFPPDCLEIEISEKDALKDFDLTLRTLRQVRAGGVLVAIDDFGSGYSSLGYLKSFPINHLKIDRSFIKDVDRASPDMAISKAMIVMAHVLDIKVVAEGLEREEQLDFLIKNGCDMAQGFLFSPPLPARDMLSLLKEKTHLLPERFE